MKKLISLALAAAMAMGVSTMALAADYASNSSSGGSGSGGGGSTGSGGSKTTTTGLITGSGSFGSNTSPVVSTSAVTKALSSGKAVTISANTTASQKVMQTVKNSKKPVTFKAPNYTISIDPTTVTETKNVSLSLQPANTVVENHFSKYYVNNFASVKFAQKGSFGATLTVTVKPTNLSKLNTASLVFYTYDIKTNTYTTLDTTYTVNKDGSITFSTPVGGDIIITDGPMTLK